MVTTCPRSYTAGSRSRLMKSTDSWEEKVEFGKKRLSITSFVMRNRWSGSLCTSKTIRWQPVYVSGLNCGLSAVRGIAITRSDQIASVMPALRDSTYLCGRDARTTKVGDPLCGRDSPTPSVVEATAELWCGRPARTWCSEATSRSETSRCPRPLRRSDRGWPGSRPGRQPL